VSDTKFNCPHCNQKLEVPQDMLGQVIDCPTCNRKIQLLAAELPKPKPKSADVLPPASSTPSQPSPQGLKDSRPCPFCGETILSVAKKCKHCGEFLDPKERRHIEASRMVTGIPLQSKKRSGCLPVFLVVVVFGIILLIVAVINAPPASEAYEKGRELGAAMAMTLPKQEIHRFQT